MSRPPVIRAFRALPGELVIDNFAGGGAPEHNGKPLAKTAQISLAGNSVCPQVAEAIVVANTRGAA